MEDEEVATGEGKPGPIAIALKSAMLKRGLNQNEIAERVGCSSSSVSHWLNGKRAIGEEEILKVDEAIGVPLSEIFLSVEGGYPASYAILHTMLDNFLKRAKPEDVTHLEWLLKHFLDQRNRELSGRKIQ